MQLKGFDEPSKSHLPRRTSLIVSAAAIIVLSLLAGVKPALGAPTITANPNPVLIPQGKNEGTTVLSWDAGAGRADSRVWIQVDSDREEIFAASAKGTSEITVVMDKTYTFRLYSGDGAQVLASIVVKARRPDPPKPSLPAIPRSAPEAHPAYLYGVLPDGSLKWYRHDGRGRGSAEWQGPRDITSGLTGLKQVFAGGGYHVFYTIAPDGTLKWFKHSFTDTAGELDTRGRDVPQNVGNGWQNFKHVFSTGGGSIYAVTQDGMLKWYLYDKAWDGPKDMGSGWGNFKNVFSTGDGVIYAITQEGKLLWFKHNFYKYGVSTEGHGPNGQPAWGGPKEVGTGWQNFRQVFSPGDGIIYAVTKEGRLLWYRHQGYRTGSSIWLPPREVASTGWENFEFAFALLNVNDDWISYDRKTPSEVKGIPPVFSVPAGSESFFQDLIIQPASDGATISYTPAADCRALIKVSTHKPNSLPESTPYVHDLGFEDLFPPELKLPAYCNEFELFAPQRYGMRRDCRIGGLAPNTTYFFVIMALTFNNKSTYASDYNGGYDKAFFFSGSFVTKSRDTIRPRNP
jgi:tachylectin